MAKFLDLTGLTTFYNKLKNRFISASTDAISGVTIDTFQHCSDSQILLRFGPSTAGNDASYNGMYFTLNQIAHQISFSKGMRYSTSPSSSPVAVRTANEEGETITIPRGSVGYLFIAVPLDGGWMRIQNNSIDQWYSVNNNSTMGSWDSPVFLDKIEEINISDPSYLQMNYSKITGSLDDVISNWTNLLMLTNINPVGDGLTLTSLDNLPKGMAYLALDQSKQKNPDGSPRALTYTSGSRRGDSFSILAIGADLMVNHIDDLLNDWATNNSAAIASSMQVIRLIGSRTSASDAAVTTLTQEGYTVTVTAPTA